MATFTEWLEEVEVYSLRIERFISDCDHHREGSTGSNERMIAWLRAAYEVRQSISGCSSVFFLDSDMTNVVDADMS